MSRRVILALAAVAVVAVVCVGAAADDEAASQSGLRVDSARIDLGQVIAGDEAVATFIFHNDGAEDVAIIRAKPS